MYQPGEGDDARTVLRVPACAARAQWDLGCASAGGLCWNCRHHHHSFVPVGSVARVQRITAVVMGSRWRGPRRSTSPLHGGSHLALLLPPPSSPFLRSSCRGRSNRWVLLLERGKGAHKWRCSGSSNSGTRGNAAWHGRRDPADGAGGASDPRCLSLELSTAQRTRRQQLLGHQQSGRCAIRCLWTGGEQRTCAPQHVHAPCAPLPHAAG